MTSAATVTDWVGYVAATLTTLSFVPQAWHTFQTRDVSGISLGMYSAFTLGVLLWLVYGVLLGAWLLFGDGFAFSHWVAFVAVLLLGWLSTLVIGVAAKILPHMSYMRLAPIMPGFKALGSPNRLLHDDWQHASALLLTAGWSGTAAGALLGHSDLTRIGALVWSSGVVLTAANYAQMYVRGRWPARQPNAMPASG